MELRYRNIRLWKALRGAKEKNAITQSFSALANILPQHLAAIEPQDIVYIRPERVHVRSITSDHLLGGSKCIGVSMDYSSPLLY